MLGRVSRSWTVVDEYLGTGQFLRERSGRGDNGISAARFVPYNVINSPFAKPAVDGAELVRQWG